MKYHFRNKMLIIKLLYICIAPVAMIVPLWSIRVGLAFYLIGALIFPSLWLGEVALRFEIIYCLWLIFILFIRKAVSRLPFHLHNVLVRYIWFLVYIFVATLFVYLSDPGAVIDTPFAQAVSLYGLLRPLLVMLLFLNVPIDESFARRVLWMFLWLSIPLAMLSVGQSLGIDAITKLTLIGYTSPIRTPVFTLLREYEVIVRSAGVFESPVNNADYFLMVLVAIGSLLLMDMHGSFRKMVLYLFLGLAFVAGVSTLSSTFFLGVITVIGLFVIFLWYWYQRRFLRMAIGSICIVGLLSFLLVPRLTQQQLFTGTLNYQVQRILSNSTLETRYDQTTGILVGTYQAIAQRPILGWGLVQVEDAFVGDSLYVSTLYRGGIIGLILFFLIMGTILRHAWRYRGTTEISGVVNRIVLLSTLLLLVLGVGSSSFFIVRLQEWYWALVGISLNPTFLQHEAGVLRKRGVP